MRVPFLLLLYVVWIEMQIKKKMVVVLLCWQVAVTDLHRSKAWCLGPLTGVQKTFFFFTIYLLYMCMKINTFLFPKQS